MRQSRAFRKPVDAVLKVVDAFRKLTDAVLGGSRAIRKLVEAFQLPAGAVLRVVDAVRVVSRAFRKLPVPDRKTNVALPSLSAANNRDSSTSSE